MTEMNPLPVTFKETVAFPCKCGHAYRDHENGGDRKCSECLCMGYADKPDVVIASDGSMTGDPQAIAELVEFMAVRANLNSDLR